MANNGIKRMPGTMPAMPPTSEDVQDEVQLATPPPAKKRKAVKPKPRKVVAIIPETSSSSDSSDSEAHEGDTEQVEDEPLFEDTTVVRRKLHKNHCFCHQDYVTINSKAGKTYIKCGRQEYPCNMFSTAGSEYNEQVAAVNKKFPKGCHFDTDWPECGHFLKAAVRKGGKDGGYFWSCRLGRRDPDRQCDYTQNFKGKSGKKPVPKRCLVQKKIAAPK